MQQEIISGYGFGKEYQLLLQYLDVSEANMEKGEMRVEVNISISNDKNVLGTKVEVKNLNSFRSAERAIRYELERMRDLYEEGRQGEIVQETRGWNEAKQSTFSQRTKESAQDYRYIPDPDIPKFKLSEMFNIDEIKKELPETPEQRRKYFLSKKIPAEIVEIWTNSKLISDTVKESFEFSETPEWPIMINFMANDLVALARESNQELAMGKTDFKSLHKLAKMSKENLISSRAAKDVLAILFNEGGDPDMIVKEKGLLQSNDEGALREIAQKIISANEQAVTSYKSGKENALMSLV